MNKPQVYDNVAVMEPDQADTVTLRVATPLSVRSFGLTHPGKVRATNQDQFLIAALLKALRIERTSFPQPKVQHSSDQSYLFVVADGIGGAAGGEKASALAIDSVESFMLETLQWFCQFQGGDHDPLLAEFHRALGQANARVLAEGARHPELRGMGTTLTLALSLNDELFVAHVGDTRCYLFRDAKLYRLTRDHTLVEEMVRRGALRADEAAEHRWRHVITNAVGGESAKVMVEVHKVRLEAGDAVLLCSDGLTNMVADEDIARVLQDLRDPEKACNRLVAQANEAGGKDNTTVIIARYDRATQTRHAR